MSKNRYELRKQMKSVRWVIFWVVLAQLAAELAVQAVVSFMTNPPHEYLQIAIVEAAAIGIPLAVYGRSVWSGYGRKNVRAEMKLRGCKPHLLFLAAILGITGQFVMMLLNIPANIFLREILGNEVTDAVPVALNWRDMLLGIPAVVILPAFLEEFWLRGVVFRAYNRCSTAAAVTFTTLVFALMHMRMNELAGFLMMGFVASYVLLRCGSLYAAMLYHAFSNLTALVFGFMLAGVINYIWIIFGAAAVCFAAALLAMAALTKPPKKNRTFKAGRLVMNSILSLPVILSIAVAVLRHFLL